MCSSNLKHLPHLKPPQASSILLNLDYICPYCDPVPLCLARSTEPVLPPHPQPRSSKSSPSILFCSILKAWPSSGRLVLYLTCHQHITWAANLADLFRRRLRTASTHPVDAFAVFHRFSNTPNCYKSFLLLQNHPGPIALTENYSSNRGFARESVDVDQPSDSRSLPPITNSEDPFTPSTSQHITSNVLSALDLSSPHGRPNQVAEPIPASTANIASFSSRPGPSFGQISQVLGRRRRSPGPSSLPEDRESTSPSHTTAGADLSSSPPTPNRSKRRRQDFQAMASDTTSSTAANGNTATRPHGSAELASQSTVSPGRVANGTHKAPSLVANGSSNGDKAAVSAPRLSTYFGHDTEEVTRILIQALSDMGYQAAADIVSQDSGYKLESPAVAAFRSAVLAGSWTEAEELLTGATISGHDGGHGAQGNGLVLSPGSNRVMMRFWLRQQKFLELLERRDTSRALHVLRTELTPLHHDTAKLHLLSSLLMCPSTNDVMKKANWDGARGESRKLLLAELS
ncbi:hypothetical protein E4U43_002165, partial [Claviceps pusilla]